MARLFNNSNRSSETKPVTVLAPGVPTFAIPLEPDSPALSCIISTGLLQSQVSIQRARVTQGPKSAGMQGERAAACLRYPSLAWSEQVAVPLCPSGLYCCCDPGSAAPSLTSRSGCGPWHSEIPLQPSDPVATKSPLRGRVQAFVTSAPAHPGRKDNSEGGGQLLESNISRAFGLV